MSPNWLDAMIAGRSEPPVHVRALKMDETLRLVRYEPGAAFCDWRLLPDYCQPMGIAFGGYLGCVVDQVSVFTVSSLGMEDMLHLTQDLRISYFRPMPAGDYRIEGRIINRTKSSVFVEITIQDLTGRLCAKASMMEMLRSRAEFEAGARAKA